MRGMHRPYGRPMRPMARAMMPRPMTRSLFRPYRRSWLFMPGMFALPGLLFGLFMFGLVLFWLLVAAIL